MQFKKTRLGSLSLLAALLVGMLFMSPPEYVGAQDGVNSTNAVNAAVGTAFTYQGQLADNGNPATGMYDFLFELYDAEMGGVQIGSSILLNEVEISNGYFTVLLDFGGSIFVGNPRYLAISVRSGASESSYTPLAPRRMITPNPYAIYADRASSLSAPDGNPSRAVTVSNEGFVGVGIESPVNRLHVANGSIFYQNAGKDLVISTGAEVDIRSGTSELYINAAKDRALRLNTAEGGDVIVGNKEDKLIVLGELQGKMRYSTEYIWQKGQPSVPMISADHGFCFLTYMAGKFEGTAEIVSVFIADDGLWYLGGLSGQPQGMEARARCAG